MSVGLNLLKDGQEVSEGRFGNQNESIVAQAHGKFHEIAYRGIMYGAAAQAGVAPGTALGTTACFSLYNPPKSGVDLSILRVSVGYVSGTIGAGSLLHCMDVPDTVAVAQPSSGTSLTVRQLRVGYQDSDASAKAEARTGSTVTTPVAIGVICSLTALLASTAVEFYKIVDDVEGGIIVRPGQCYQIQAIAAAGSSPLILPAVWWEETPIS